MSQVLNGDNMPKVFTSEMKRDMAVKSLLVEYSKEYGKIIETIEDLTEITFGQVYIEIYESELE